MSEINKTTFGITIPNSLINRINNLISSKGEKTESIILEALAFYFEEKECFQDAMITGYSDVKYQTYIHQMIKEDNF